jgi:hypothetical protein
MKEQEIKETAIMLRNEIAKAQQLTNDVDLHTIFLSAETIVSCLSYLISPIADMEQRYRLLVVGYMEKGDSNAAADAKAKASDEYKDWKKYTNLYELSEQQINVLKKFKDDLSKEYKRQ